MRLVVGRSSGTRVARGDAPGGDARSKGLGPGSARESAQGSVRQASGTHHGLRRQLWLASTALLAVWLGTKPSTESL